jgi:HAMP domain-containing protein
MAEEVAQGNLDSKVTYDSLVEIGVLAKNFNQMVYNLKKTTASRNALVESL